MASRKTFVLADESGDINELKSKLQKIGCEIVGTAVPDAQRVGLIKKSQPDFLLIDASGESVADFAEKAAAMCANLPAVWLVADQKRCAERTASFNTLAKPFSDRELQLMIETVLYRHEAEDRFCKIEQKLAAVTPKNDVAADDARLAAIVSFSTDAIVSRTLEGIVASWNESAERIFGYTPEEIIGQSVLRLIPAESQSEEINVLSRLKTGERIEHCEALRLAKDGRRVNVSLTISPIRSADGEIIGASEIIRDITEHKQTEERLRHSEGRFKQLADSLPQMVWTCETDGKCDFLSRRWIDFTGISKAQQLGFKWFEQIHPDDRQTAIEAWHKAIYEGTDFQGEFRIRRYDGVYRVFDTRAVRMLDDKGGIIKWFGTNTDVTDRRAAEENLRQSEENFRTLADNISQFAWMADATGWIFWYNERWFDYTGTTLEEMQGWGWRKVHHPDHVDRVVEKIQRSFITGEVWEDTFPLRGKEGEYRWFLSRALPIRDAEGEVVRWFGTNTDVEELRRARLEAEESDRLKDEFLATISHELRTPLNAILGWARVAQKKEDDKDSVRRAMQIIERNARSQDQIITDILDVSRIVSGKIELNFAPIQLSAVVRAAIDRVRSSLEMKKIQLEAKIEPDDNIEINGDADRLQQVVWNLLVNAVKFTPENGSIEVSLKYSGRHAEIVVRDSGVGIAPEFLPFVFDRFRQAENQRSRLYGGLGLGLSVARHFVEMHGGTVRAESQGKGSGATFTVDLPCETRPSGNGALPVNSAETPFVVLHRALENLKILVIDDARDSLDLASYVLADHGARVLSAASVDKALEIFDREPDVNLIVTDIGMPDKDGYDLMQELQERFARRQHSIPVIALTAYARQTEGAEILRAGFAVHMTKPFDPDLLVEETARLISETK